MPNENSLRDHALIALTVKRLADVLDTRHHPDAAAILKSLVTDLSMHEYGAVEFANGISTATTLIFSGAETRELPASSVERVEGQAAAEPPPPPAPSRVRQATYRINDDHEKPVWYGRADSPEDAAQRAGILEGLDAHDAPDGDGRWAYATSRLDVWTCGDYRIMRVRY